MITHDVASPSHAPEAPGAGLSVEKVPAHWLMARLGKRVLRPGGREATEWLLRRASIEANDDVVELAPGLGVTARAILAYEPRSYVGVERDAAAVQTTEKAIASHPSARVVRSDASRTRLPDASASVVVGEAMLSMQPVRHKQAIIREAARVLRPGGRYVIHELAVTPVDVDAELHQRLERDLSASIHVGVRIGTSAEWCGWLEEAGFSVEAVRTLPMRLLEPDRLIADEGWARTARFLWKALRTPGALARLRAVRGVFRAYRRHLVAIAIVARR